MDITRDAATGEVCCCAALPFISWNLNPTSPSYSFSVPEYKQQKKKRKETAPNHQSGCAGYDLEPACLSTVLSKSASLQFSARKVPITRERLNKEGPMSH